jgi:hypothetical protein
MQHRHLTHQKFTLAAIDDVISRGGLLDWQDLRGAVLHDTTILESVARVCSAHLQDAYAQRYHFWNHYVQKHRATA